MDTVTTPTLPSPDHGLSDRAEGALLGAAVGDALGWPAEDRSGRVGGRRDLQPSFDFIAWRRREGGRYQPHEEEIESGSYSDDTQLMLAVARSRLTGDRWWRHLTETELPFWLLYERGGGGATKRAATSWARSRPPWTDRDVARYFAAGGNGVAMRIAPHCFTPGTDFSQVATATVADGITTHGHPRALVGAIVQAYSVWRCIVRRDVLGYGELLDDVLAADEWRAFPRPASVAPDWEELAETYFKRPYEDAWQEVVAEVDNLLQIARAGIEQGALAVDKPVLEQLGAFGRSSGSGTVSAVGALFLASRYAAQPAGGVVAAAFAKGGDTDTLAAMTGSILGAIHGTEWLGSVVQGLQDAAYIRTLARSIKSDPIDYERPQGTSPVTARSFWRKFGEPRPSTSVLLPDGRSGSVMRVDEHATRRADLFPLTFVVATDDGQTLFLKRVKKQTAQTNTTPQTTQDALQPIGRPSTDELDRRPRIGVVLHVADVDRARQFYGEVVGLNVSRTDDRRTVFAGLLALEPLPPTLLGSHQSEQLTLDSAPSFETTCALTLYVHKFDFDEVRIRVMRAGRPLSDVTLSDGRPTFRCLDPDGNVVEFRARNGT